VIDIVCIIVTTDVAHIRMCNQYALCLVSVDVVGWRASLLIPRHASHLSVRDDVDAWLPSRLPAHAIPAWLLPWL